MQNWQELDTDIVRIAARLTPDEMLRDDLAQEMRIRVWQAPDGKTRAWYLATARWHAVKFLTRTAVDCPDGDLDRQVTLYGVLGDVDPEVLRYIPSDWHETLLSAPIDLASETLALSLEVTETLSLLTSRQQQVAYALAQGFTQREIADALSLSQRTVASEVARIRAVFRKEHGPFGMGGSGQASISKKGLHT
jgi:RNA polymerase sigma factor (sigma-70 family)